MVLPDLFIQKERSFEKEASFRLSTDANQWEQDIITKLHEEHPYFPDYDLDIKIRKKDEQLGAGIGQIVVDDKIRIPVIIKEFKLEPLDLMYYNGELLPITRASIENITHKNTLGKPVKPNARGADMGIRSATQAPHYGKYSYASLEYTTDQLADALGNAYETESGLLYDLKDSERFRAGVHRFIQNAGTVKEAAAPAPKVEIMNITVLEDVHEGGVRTVGAEGVMCKVASLDGTITDRTMFLGTKGEYCERAYVPGFSKQVKLASAQPKGYGVFYINKNGANVCTEPINIMYKSAGEIRAHTNLGAALTINIGEHYTGFEKIAEEVFLSDEWQFMPLKRKLHLSDAKELNKLSSIGCDITVKRIGNQYVISGRTEDLPEVHKYANHPVTFHEVKNGFSAYCTPDQVEQIRADADAYTQSKIKTYVAGVGEEEAVQIPTISAEDRRHMIKAAGLLTEEVIKLADVEEEDADRTIDAILGLNVLNKENVYRVLEMIEDLEVARAVLARILMLGRIGLEIDKNSVRAAVYALDAVIKDLRRFKQVQMAD